MNPQKRMVYIQKIFNPSQYRSNGMSTLNKDNFNRLMLESINKVLNPNEGPIKEKHVRKLLIGSFQTESGIFFWRYVPMIKLKANQIVCWKFCHLLHKIIRDGHREVVNNSFEKRQTLLDCGHMWRHLEDGYGLMVYKYCNLLYNRINFLVRNPLFPNDLKVSAEQLDVIGEHDSSVFFDLSCEIFDSLDDILNLQEAVLASLETKKFNSMSASGQCHLAPLVACIQDSTLLYDLSVKILFKLHGALPATTLEGHRERFLSQHKALKNFYLSTSHLQYFKTLIQIPHLSDRSPNFLIASDLQQHVAPRVIMIDKNEGESPDQLLVSLEDDQGGTEDGSLSSSHDQQQEVSSSFTSPLPGSTNDVLFDQSNDPFAASSSTQHQASLMFDSQPQTNNTSAEADQKIQDLEIMVAELRSSLESEQLTHKRLIESLQEELATAKKEISNLKHQLVASTNAYRRLDEDYQRAKHENEITQVAMKKLMGDMSDLKRKQVSDRAVDTARIESIKREEDLLVAEMNETDKIIQEATRKIEELSEKSRKLESGIKLQVNEKIAEVCTNLMKAVRNLIVQSRHLQREIGEPVKSANNYEFYRRDSSWTEGLISAANVVAVAARSLVDAADKSLSGQAKFSELGAAAHEVATATTQLVVASRVKADKDSEKLKILLNAAKQVNQCTSNVVDASRVCAELIEQEVDKIDIASLSLHQTKRLEMETQVKLLELEAALTKERSRLGLLRRQHYEFEEAEQTALHISGNLSK